MLISIVAFLLAGCGSGSCPSASPMTPEELSAYEAVEECSRLAAAPPLVLWRAVKPCPTSGKPCCMDGGRNFQCGDAICGVRGQYLTDCATIELARTDPNVCGSDEPVLKHESLHHLLFENFGDADNDHRRREWQDCGL